MDWKKIFMNDMPSNFLIEVALRSVIMFTVLLLALRASGKRGIKQFSVFELVLVIGLGSAAGDPMFYDDVGILPAMLVFCIIIVLYLGITKLAHKITWIERLLEGEAICVISDGKVDMKAFSKSGVTQDELFSELRVQNVEHLGQVRTVLIETSGQFSILYYIDHEVKPGLPIFPALLKRKSELAPQTGLCACGKCGHIQELNQGEVHNCPVCSCTDWVIPLAGKRVV